MSASLPLQGYVGAGDWNAYRTDFISKVEKDARILADACLALRDDEDVVRIAVRQCPFAIRYASVRVRMNKELTLLAIKKSGMAIEFVDPSFKDDYDVAMLVVKKTGMLIQRVSTRLANDKRIAMQAATKDGLALAHAGDDMKDDHDVVLAAVSKNGLALKHASDRLKGDKQIVLQAAQRDGRSFSHATSAMQDDDDFVRDVVRACVTAFKHASRRLRSSREFVYALLQEGHRVLRYATAPLQADKIIVSEAVKQHGGELEFADKAWRADEEMAMLAAKNCDEDEQSLKGLSPDLLANEELVMTAVKKSGVNLLCVPSALLTVEMVTVAFETITAKSLPITFCLLPSSLRDDKEVVMAAVRRNGATLAHVKQSLRADREVVLLALESGATGGLRHASDELRADREVVEKAVTHYKALREASPAVAFQADFELRLIEARHTSATRALRIVKEFGASPRWQDKTKEMKRVEELLRFFKDDMRFCDYVERMQKELFRPGGVGCKRTLDALEDVMACLH